MVQLTIVHPSWVDSHSQSISQSLHQGIIGTTAKGIDVSRVAGTIAKTIDVSRVTGNFNHHRFFYLLHQLHLEGQLNYIHSLLVQACTRSLPSLTWGA